MFKSEMRSCTLQHCDKVVVDLRIDEDWGERDCPYKCMSVCDGIGTGLWIREKLRRLPGLALYKMKVKVMSSLCLAL
jgi:hypothetical protein